MSENNPGNSSSKAMESPSVNRASEKTQVFILSPDILKKLGVASHIPNLQSLINKQNDDNKTQSSSTTTIKSNPVPEISVNDNVIACEKNINSNKIETRNENISESVVQSKSVSILSPELDNKNESFASNTEKSIIDKHVNIEKNKCLESKQTLNDSLTSSQTKNQLENINNKQLIKEKSPTPKHTEMKYISTPIKSKNQNPVISENEKQTIKTKIPDIESKQLSQYFNDKLLESSQLQINKRQSVTSRKDENLSDLNASSSTSNNNLSINEYYTLKNESITNSIIDKMFVQKETNKTVESKESETNATVRKSTRKRKLSNLHDDYVTELKLHDGKETKAKKVNIRNRKSMENRINTAKETDKLLVMDTTHTNTTIDPQNMDRASLDKNESQTSQQISSENIETITTKSKPVAISSVPKKPIDLNTNRKSMENRINTAKETDKELVMNTTDTNTTIDPQNMDRASLNKNESQTSQQISTENIETITTKSKPGEIATVPKKPIDLNTNLDKPKEKCVELKNNEANEINNLNISDSSPHKRVVRTYTRKSQSMQNKTESNSISDTQKSDITMERDTVIIETNRKKSDDANDNTNSTVLPEHKTNENLVQKNSQENIEYNLSIEQNSNESNIEIQNLKNCENSKIKDVEIVDKIDTFSMTEKCVSIEQNSNESKIDIQSLKNCENSKIGDVGIDDKIVKTSMTEKCVLHPENSEKCNNKSNDIICESESNVVIESKNDTAKPGLNNNETLNLDTTIETEINNSISENVSEKPVTAKKRGRKKKIIPPDTENPVKPDNNETPNLDTTVETEINNSVSENVSEKLVTAKKRGRKKKIILPETENPVKPEIDIKIETPEPKQPGRKSKRYIKEEIEEETEKNPENNFGTRRQSRRIIENDSDAEEEIELPIRKRGRKKKKIESENEDIDQTITPIKTTNKTIVKCGVCNEEMNNYQWKYHSMKHYNLCWKIGQPEIDLKDEKLVSKILQNYLQSKKGLMLECRVCGDKKKSVVGYLSHQEVCQKTPEEILALRAECPVCHRLMMNSSLKVHMSVHNEAKRNLKTEALKEPEKIETPSPEGRIRRKAAAKAVGLIQKVTCQEEDKKVPKKNPAEKVYRIINDSPKSIMSGGLFRLYQTDLRKTNSVRCKIKNCKFETSDLQEIKIHINNCPELKKGDLICSLCLFLTENETTMINHVKKNHIREKEEAEFEDSEVSEDEDDYDEDDEEFEENETGEGDGKKKILKIGDFKKSTYKYVFLARESRIPPSIICSYPATIKWTKEFYKENYSDRLFENLIHDTSNWMPVSETEQYKYLPIHKKSISVRDIVVKKSIPNLQDQEHSWKEFDIYETDLTADAITIFCGGPIWSVAWLPTPYDKTVDQYLAVSVQKDYEMKYKISQSYQNEELIQFWNFGPLSHKTKLTEKPVLEFCLAHNHGMVWHMEWCPSGCYDVEEVGKSRAKRLGMLALACSDGSIPVYTIYSPDTLQTCDGQKIYKTKESYRLIIQDDGEQKLGLWDYQVTKLNWSKAKGHNIIAGGCSNGVVGLWNLEFDSPLLKSEENGVIILKPYYVFQPHMSCVTVVEIHPLDDGKRWLLTGSWDRSVKYWDLHDTSSPITNFNKRGLVTDGVWLTHWLCSFITYDDVFNLGHTVTSVQSVRDFGFKQTTALSTNSMVTSISGNDWANAILQGSVAGDLTASFPRQLLVSFDIDKGHRCKRMIFGYTDKVDKTKTPKEILKSVEKKKTQKIVDVPENEDSILSENNKEDEIESFEEWPETYEAAKKKFGVIFCDFDLRAYSNIPEGAINWIRQSSRMREAPTELYPILSINRVQWNPNKQAYLFMSSGYHAGFVRVKCVQFMNTPYTDI